VNKQRISEAVHRGIAMRPRVGVLIGIQEMCCLTVSLGQRISCNQVWGARSARGPLSASKGAERVACHTSRGEKVHGPKN